MEAVRTGLRQIMQDLLRARPAEEAVFMAWPLVCGRQVAMRSHPVAFSDGTLTVEVPDAEWRNQLQSFALRYVNGYQELLGPQVRKIEFRLKSSVTSQQSANPAQSAPTNNSASSTNPDASDASIASAHRIGHKKAPRG